MTARLITLCLRQVLRLLLLACRSSRSKDLELLVLRQDAVLRRQVPDPKTTCEERLVFTVPLRLRPVHERLSNLFMEEQAYKLAGNSVQVLDYDLDDLGRNAGPKARVERDFWSALRRDAIVLAGSQLDDLIENVR